MKPFNLKEALAGKPVITRDGREVTQLTFFKDPSLVYPVFALLDGNLAKFTNDGRFYYASLSSSDLVMASEKKSIWVNVYESHDGVLWVSDRYESKKEAEETANTCSELHKYIKSIEITNEKIN